MYKREMINYAKEEKRETLNDAIEDEDIELGFKHEPKKLFYLDSDFKLCINE